MATDGTAQAVETQQGADAAREDQTQAAVPALMADKRGLVMGVANDHSIAWGIAKCLHDRS